MVSTQTGDGGQETSDDGGHETRPPDQDAATAEGEAETSTGDAETTAGSDGDASLEEAAAREREYLRGRLRDELGREPTDEELNEWLREHTEGY
ncbi:MAG: hypothetical protein QOG71_1438 [Pyrinomonadaceae bacterium]|nr:hypothetical protein [Pyrinomonadaceae bacterium]